jgi:hypothetical protein
MKLVFSPQQNPPEGGIVGAGVVGAGVGAGVGSSHGSPGTSQSANPKSEHGELNPSEQMKNVFSPQQFGI